MGALISQMGIHQAKIGANHEELMVIMQAGQDNIEAIMEACLEKARVGLEEMEAAVDGFKKVWTKWTRWIWRPIEESRRP
jgi:hypothetical protein